MDTSHTWEEQRDIIKDFLQKMCDSGYGESTRSEVIKSATTKYFRQLMEQESGGRRLYRSAQEMAAGRRLKGLLNQTWFKSKRGGSKVTSAKDLPWKLQYIEEECKREYPRNNNKKKGQDVRSQEEQRTKSVETVVFIPSTPGSKLRIHLQDADDRLVISINSPSVRFVERGGPSFLSRIFNM